MQVILAKEKNGTRETGYEVIIVYRWVVSKGLRERTCEIFKKNFTGLDIGWCIKGKKKSR